MSQNGIKARMLRSMKKGIRRKDEAKSKPKKPVYKHEPSRKLHESAMEKEYKAYRKQQREDPSFKKTRNDDFISFIDWLETRPEGKGNTWSKGRKSGGRNAAEATMHADPKVNKTADDLIRPEEYTALWIMSPNGRLALDALENGVVLPKLWEELRHLRSAMGSDQLTQAGLLPDILNGMTFKMGDEAGAARNLATMQGAATNVAKSNLGDLQEITDLFNQHMTTGFQRRRRTKTGKLKAWGKTEDFTPDTHKTGLYDTEYVGALFQRITGIADAKEGFMKHYLGIGDTTTVDSQQIRWWLTGLESGVRGAEDSLERVKADFYTKLRTQGGVSEELIERIKKKNEELLKSLQGPNPKDSDLNAHILHHWLWDKIMGVPSASPASKSAITLAQKGVLGRIKGGITFGQDGEAILNLFTRSFSDRYGRTYEASDFSTIVHEVAHIYRRAMLDPIAVRRSAGGKPVEGFLAGPSKIDDLGKIEKHLGVVNSQWTREHEERFAELFEKWILGGAEADGMEQIFGNMKGWMAELYRNVHNSPLRGSVTTEVKGVFSRIFGKEGLPTFLTPKDNDNLANAFDAAIEEGVSLDQALEEVGLNLRLWDNESEAEDVMQGLAAFVREKGLLKKWKNAKGKPGEGGVGISTIGADGSLRRAPEDIQTNKYTLEIAEKMADELGMNHDQLARQLREDASSFDNAAEHLVAGKLLLNSYAQTVFQHAQKVANGEGGEEAAYVLKILQSKFVDVYQSVIRINRGAGRTVQAGNIPIKGIDPDQMYQVMLNSGGMGKVKQFAPKRLSAEAGKLVQRINAVCV